MDALTLKRIELLHPKLRAEATTIYSEICAALTGRAMCRYTFTLRSLAEQNALYAQGRTKPGSIVTNAKGGQSWHNWGMAVDIALVLDTNKDGKFDTASWDDKGDYDADKHSDWMEIVAIFKKHGWVWGGDFKSIVDKPHFQKTFGLTLKGVAAKKLDAHGYVII